MVLYRAPTLPVGQRTPPPPHPKGTEEHFNSYLVSCIVHMRKRGTLTYTHLWMVNTIGVCTGGMLQRVFYDTHTWGSVNRMPNVCRQVQWWSSLSNLTHWEGGTGPIFKTFRHLVFIIRAACKTVSWGTSPKAAKQAVPHQHASHTIHRIQPNTMYILSVPVFMDVSLSISTNFMNFTARQLGEAPYSYIAS